MYTALKQGASRLSDELIGLHNVIGYVVMCSVNNRSTHNARLLQSYVKFALSKKFSRKGLQTKNKTKKQTKLIKRLHRSVIFGLTTSQIQTHLSSTVLSLRIGQTLLSIHATNNVHSTF